ncbi:hypothetical protein D9O50_11670 [Oxalobacteraceae bacterium CAVE-383]|nr:hypothetical protein D9O50_11670 [Oxalobacteraceae bacterium CAVE-383]
MSSTQKSVRPVLLAVLEYGEVPELLRVAESAQAALQAPIIFMFVKRGYRRLAEDTGTVINKGFRWMDANGILHDLAAPQEMPPPEATVNASTAVSDTTNIPIHPSRRNAFGKLMAALAFPWFAILAIVSACRVSVRAIARDTANLVRDVKRFRARYLQLSKIISELRPRLLIVGQDSPGNELSFLLIAAGRIGVPRLITPFAMFSIHETAEYACAQCAYHVNAGAMNRLAAFIFPHWVLRYRNTDLLRLPGYRAIALEISGLIQGMPWSPLSEPAEAVIANAVVAAEALIELGSSANSLHVIGSPIQDRLANHMAERSAIRHHLCHEYGMDPAKPLIVCGWPVNMFSWLAERRIAYADYAAVARTWATILAEVRDRHDVNIIVSVHPKTLPRETAAAIAAGLPCRYADADELIAVCDLFTTLNGSSITAWAISCGIPVVLFDCFLTRYPDFLNVAGCISVETESAFSETLHMLCADRTKRDALAELQRKESARWGQLDGKAGARLAELIQNLSEKTAE